MEPPTAPPPTAPPPKALPTEGTEATVAGDYTIGMANFTLCCAYFIGMDEAVLKEAEAAGTVEVISTDANGDAAKLTSDIEDLIVEGVDGVIISAGPSNRPRPRWKPSMRRASPSSWLTGSSPRVRIRAGSAPTTKQSAWLPANTSPSGCGEEGTVVIVKGGPADNTIGLARTEGMLSVVEETEIETVTAPDFGGWSEDGGLAVMESLLVQHDDISAVFCENDSMCLGAQIAIADAGRSEEMFIVGVDGQKEALEAIMEEPITRRRVSMTPTRLAGRVFID